MDHRCLYGHRVPETFTFAIQNRVCPTCGANTVTLNGYQAARRLTQDAQLDAVIAFNAVRVLEAEWVLTPMASPADEDEVAVVEDTQEAPAPAAAIEPPKPVKVVSRAEKAAAKAAEKAAEKADEASDKVVRPAEFEQAEDEFFKQA